MDKNLKSVFINFPLGKQPTDFPPYGAMAVINSLRRAGYKDTSLLNLDVSRGSLEESVDYIAALKPDILCISSPVSTHYNNCKTYSSEIKKRLPSVKIVLGGNLAASAEVILKNTNVDFCVLGEGEKTACLLFDAFSDDKPIEKCREIKGLAFLDGGRMINTGYSDPMPKEEIFDVDWDTLDNKSLDFYFPAIKDLDVNSPALRLFFMDRDGNIKIDGDKLNKRMGWLSCSKGCVARCTFCHRFNKGIRFIPPEILERRIRELTERFNVGAISFGDECFGANTRWLTEFCEMIKPLNLLWRVGGMRVNLVTPEIIARMKDAGCRCIIYGTETGSERMLKVMQKAVAGRDNYNAMKWTVEAGFFTSPQLVIGMPGESMTTIEESADFMAYAMTLDKSQNPMTISINFAQALPGTPLYEYARAKGLIGDSIEAEEEYLMSVSDRSAADETTTLNFTQYPRLIQLSWPMLIASKTRAAYVKKFGRSAYYGRVFPTGNRPGILNMLLGLRMRALYHAFPVAAYGLKNMLWVLKLMEIVKEKGVREGMRLLGELVLFIVTGGRRKSSFEYKSLRKILEQDTKKAYAGAEEMRNLRKGR